MEDLMERLKNEICGAFRQGQFPTETCGRWCFGCLGRLLDGWFGTVETDGGKSCRDGVTGRSYTLRYLGDGDGFEVTLTEGDADLLRLVCGGSPHHTYLNGEAIPFSPQGQERVTALLEKLLFEGIYGFRLPEMVQADMENRDFFRNDLLVGSLRNQEQLTASLKHMYYHVPADAAGPEGEQVEYVALLLGRKHFGAQAGVRYVGKVLSVQRVRRDEIDYLPKRGDREYYLYHIERWQRLPMPITMDESGFVCGYTSLLRLQNSRYLSQLFAQSAGQFRLYACIDAYASGPLVNRPGLVYRVPCGDRVVALEEGHIRIYRAGTAVLNFAPEDFLASPATFFRRIRGETAE